MINDSKKHFYFRVLNLFVLLFVSGFLTAQYPFEKFPGVAYKSYKHWKFINNEKLYRSVARLSIPNFYKNGDKLSIVLYSFDRNDSSYICLYRNKKLVRRIFDKMYFTSLNLSFEPVRVADINGDSLNDIKITAAWMGSGIACMYNRIIYLFQDSAKGFRKISFTDMISENRSERDIDGDGNYEIITMNLQGYRDHNYWLFNLYQYQKGGLVNVNYLANYPIMVQLLYRPNFAITKKLSREKMKSFEMKLPPEYDKR